MASVQALKDPNRESRIFSARSVLVLVVVLSLLGLLLARYFSLQINQYEIYRTESDRNRVQYSRCHPSVG